MRKAIFALVCIGIMTFVVGDAISSDLLENIALGIFVCTGGGYAIYKNAHPKNQKLYMGILTAIVICFIIGESIDIFEDIYVGLIFIWIAYTIYFKFQHRTETERKTKHLESRIQVLKTDLKEINTKIEENHHYLKNNEIDSYIALSRQIYPRLKSFDEQLASVKEAIPSDYARIHKKIINEAKSIKENFKKLEVKLVPSDFESHEERVRLLAPEIWETYHSIQIDHETIVNKLKEQTIDNTQELLALHEAYMKRFDDLFKTYLEIKETPKNYYYADERLEQAKLALEKIDLALDEQLRQLNEHDLGDFEVSLRLMLEE